MSRERVSRKRLGKAKAEALHDAAANSLGLSALSGVAQLEVRALLAQMGLLEAQVVEADAAIADLLSSIPQFLSSIPGVGAVLSATIVAEIGDIQRFTTPQTLVAYAGLDPSVFDSGAFHGKRQHLSKRGSPYLRRSLYLAAVSACRTDPELHDYLRAKTTEGKTYTEAVVATARKLLLRIYVILKEGRPYVVRPSSESKMPNADGGPADRVGHLDIS